MPERPARIDHQPRHQARDAYRPGPCADTPYSLTLRVRGDDGAQARARLEDLLGDLPGLRILTVCRHRGVVTLALQAPREELDPMLHRIMMNVMDAELGPIQPAALAAVH
ncbi:hypothetical protein CAL26_20520 [Bordetella genomosp. 9]|uniref:Uncharacterized protein n=1 Tax=Bordetella genomosp. 9 TaxID=1416803 RepID=A0A261R6G8_9BORD|nr:hypothetical protein [Bordetella genomosp. 9]OZI19943.1 hypothetical protein CAL26_20520 [Bordetella genomosp. 9]